ncbi:MAG: glycine--tRNA ligase subunit beta, partial [Elusimicrobiales bacterium]|nr:glycine--tRNA ligase subunit beta [Elusimicrobiales bacterium]
QKNVRDGFKNVLEARFKDALFFYKKDLAMPLDLMNDKLQDITFHQGLGTMYDKCHRIKECSTILSKGLKLEKLNKEEIFRASEYIYCDLASEVVKEFTELQGIMAYYYAKNANLSKGVCKSIKEFYWPLSSISALPASVESSVVSLSGKIDTILSSFAVGITVTGSADPYALRRHAMGLTRIIIAKKFSLNLNSVLKEAFEFLPKGVKEKSDKEKLFRDILEFIWQRAEAVFIESGYKFDEIRAVKSYFIESGDLTNAARRIKSLNTMRKNPDFESLAASFKRAKNILKQTSIKETDMPDETLFEEDAEKALYKNIQSLSLKGGDILKNNDYSSYLSELVKIKPALDGFFDNVMVMVKDEKVKTNRLKIIKFLVVLFAKAADLSQIQG